MCGIIAYVGNQEATQILLDGLQQLEYRGYDSAGIAVLNRAGELDIRKSTGKISNLISLIGKYCPLGSTGIGHTRWATHGRPSEQNAHPHTDCSGKITVVQNGIIENYTTLRDDLKRQGHVFTSETDTEILAHLIEDHYKLCPGDLLKAVRLALSRVTGSYAIVVMSKDEPGRLVGAKLDVPLIVGLGKNEYFLASDASALLKHTRCVLVLEEGELASLDRNGVTLYDMAGGRVERQPIEIDWDIEAAEKGGYPHFVLKEIHEQPTAIRTALLSRIVNGRLKLPELDTLDLQEIKRIVVLACGSSAYAGLVAKYVIENWARYPVEVIVASEFRYSNPVVGPDTLCLAITQSGETADTIAAVRQAREQGATVLAITNVVGSAITRIADAVLYQQAGPEIGVVATKSFVTQLTLLNLVALYLGKISGTIKEEQAQSFLSAIQALPSQVQRILDKGDSITPIARKLAHSRSFMFIGRGVGYPIALEGALKLKEISYIHAEGYPAGELKHGPIALLDPETPLLAIATAGKTYDKVISNIQEVRARQAQVVVIATEGDSSIVQHADYIMAIPYTLELLAPTLQVIPLQLFAYHAAVELGCNVDQPRNLAKSVTVE